MRLPRLALALLVFAAAPAALAQTPPPPAPEPAPPQPPTPAPPAEPPPPPPEPVPPPESAPATEAVPETEHVAEPAPPPSAVRDEKAAEAEPPAPKEKEKEAPVPPPFERAHTPLTLEAGLGLSWRPGESGFDDESGLGTELGLSLYLDIAREFAAGLEGQYTSLGRGSALSGRDSINAEYSVTSAMLGFRAYPWRSQLVDVYVGLQLGLGFQAVSATGTSSNGSLEPASVYDCSGSDTPGFQLGGGIGGRVMLTPRIGVAARLNATGRRLGGEPIDDCARGIGTSTTVSAGIGVGYDFDLDP